MVVLLVLVLAGCPRESQLRAQSIDPGGDGHFARQFPTAGAHFFDSVIHRKARQLGIAHLRFFFRIVFHGSFLVFPCSNRGYQHSRCSVELRNRHIAESSVSSGFRTNHSLWIRPQQTLTAARALRMARAALPDHRPALVPAVQAPRPAVPVVQAQVAQAGHLPVQAVRVPAPVLPAWKRYPRRPALTRSG